MNKIDEEGGAVIENIVECLQSKYERASGSLSYKIRWCIIQ